MSKIAHYLQEHVIGEVMTSVDARRYFATDASIFSLAPALVIYPRNENDVRKTARFTWQLAERGRVIPITARGSGTDQTGAALGNGIAMVFPAHMNRILELDTKSGMVSVEPGINYGKLQQSLHTHGRFLPPYPASLEYSTIGGAVANNASGEKSIKYGDTRAYVQSLRVVLANGEVIETGRITKRELSKKLGLATFEGEIYRSVDTLLEEQGDLIEQLERNVTMNNAGYDLMDVKQRDGSFDLTPLFVGSQGTLGIITETLLSTELHNPETTLMVSAFDSLDHAQNAILELRALSEMPSAIEMVDGNVLKQVHDINPNQLKNLIQAPYPSLVLFTEFDTGNERARKKVIKRAQKILEKYAVTVQVETELEKQQQLWKIRHSTSMLLGHSDGAQRAIPIIEDAAVPPNQLAALITGAYSLFARLSLAPAIWGHAGDGNVHVQPQLNLSQIGDRQKAFKLMDEYYALVLNLGGTISAEHNDGRLRAPYVERQYGSEAYTLFQKIKQIFDPYGTLNPGVKIGSSLDDIKGIIRSDYGLAHLYDYLPHN
jgi:FAD/FMN-containing dehydrogenase